MSNSSIWPIDRTLSGATTADQSEPGSDGNDPVLCKPQSSGIIETLPSDFLVSYPEHSLGRVLPFWRDAVGVFDSPSRVGYTKICLIWRSHLKLLTEPVFFYGHPCPNSIKFCLIWHSDLKLFTELFSSKPGTHVGKDNHIFPFLFRHHNVCNQAIFCYNYIFPHL